MAAPETQGKRTVFIILVSSCVFFSADKVIRLVRFQGRQGGFMSSKVQAYVFTLLSAVFIGLAHKEPEAE